jgi:hypothetical protein
MAERDIIIRFGAERSLRRISIDLEETPKFFLGDEPVEYPGCSDAWVFYSVEYQLYFCGLLPFVRVNDEQVRWPHGHIQRVLPRHAEFHRDYRGLTVEEAQELARRRGKSLPIRKAGDEEPTIPEALRDAVKAIPQVLLGVRKAHRDQYPKSVNVPALLLLIVKGWGQVGPPDWEMQIPLDQIINHCHKGKSKTPPKTIQTTTVAPTQLAIDDARVPLSLTLTQAGVLVELRLLEVDGGQLGI